MRVVLFISARRAIHDGTRPNAGLLSLVISNEEYAFKLRFQFRTMKDEDLEFKEWNLWRRFALASGYKNWRQKIGTWGRTLGAQLDICKS